MVSTGLLQKLIYPPQNPPLQACARYGIGESYLVSGNAFLHVPEYTFCLSGFDSLFLQLKFHNISKAFVGTEMTDNLLLSDL